MSTSPERPANQAGGEGGERRSRPANGGAPRRRKRKRSPLRIVLSIFGWIFKILGTILLVGVVTGCFVACYGMVYIQTVIMPEAAKLDLDAFVLNESSTIYYVDKNDRVVELATCYGQENREILEYDQIPEVFINTAIAVEDKRFLQHKGVDWIRTAAAVVYMFTGRDIQGGSTITQQVIKNYTQEDEVTVKRKITEIFRALSVEDRYSKEDIITMYLNYIYLGQGQYGIATAARYYFNKDVSQITLAEAASIIAITNNPSLYSPYSTVQTTDSETGKTLTGLERNKQRQELILWLMCYGEGINMISEAEYKAAIAQPLNFAKGESSEETTNVNSWYVDQAIAETVKYFIAQGYTTKAANDLIYGGGLHIYTPFDPTVQAAVDEIYTNMENLPYTSKDGQQMQSSITVVDNETGYVVAMAGQMGEKTGNRWWNFSTDSTRQPGSSIKPLAAYSPAIEMGLVTPYTIIDDSPYQMLNGKPWPRNDSRTYKGLVTVLDGITHSTNTVAVKLVGDYVTPEASFRFLQERYGITTVVDHRETSSGKVLNDYGASQLALGGLTDGLKPYEMAAAYATFPRGGLYTAPTVVLRVENRDHQVIWDNRPVSTPVIRESTAHYMNILLQAARSGTGRLANFSGMHVAGKTGTTTDNFDRWFAGYTPYYTAVVWTGYQRNAKMMTDGNPAADLWRKVMSIIHEDLEDRDFFSVSNTTSASICLDCGQLATDACANDIRGSRSARYSFVAGTQPGAYCTCHVPITVCTEAPIIGADGMAVANAYHEAGPFCPEESVKTVTVVSRYRDPELCADANVQDRFYMYSFYEALRGEEADLISCPVHTDQLPAEPDPNDPNNPNYTDPNDPNYEDPNAPPEWIGPGTTTDPGGEPFIPPVVTHPVEPPVIDPPVTDPTPPPTSDIPPDDFIPASE